jgi:hypothetical protein
MKLFEGLDKPYFKDWIFYLWILGEIAIVPRTLGAGYGGVAGLIDFIFGSIFQYLLFMRLPIFIRETIRQRQK